MCFKKAGIKIGILSLLISVVGFFVHTQTLQVVAEEAWEAAFNQRKAEVEGKIGAVNTQVTQYESQINDLSAKQKQLSEQIKVMQDQIAATDKLIQQTKDEIQKVEVQIDDNNKQLEVLKKDMKTVFIEMQTAHVGSVFEVVLSSSNLDELLGKMNSLDTMQSKLDLLHKQTESKIKELNANKKLLADSQEALNRTQAFNKSRRDQLATLIEETKGQQAEYEKILGKLEAQKSQYSEEIAKIDSEKIAEARRIEAERERNRILRSNIGNGSSIGNPSGSVGTDPGGADWNACNGVREAIDTKGLPTSGYVFPAERGVFTSGFGCQSDYWYGGVHDAADIASSSGGNKILAFSGGSVIVASTSGPLGNHVILKHNFGSRVIYTVYGHMRSGSIMVSPGESVSPGQALGIMGSTGNSTGTHLHFAILDETYGATGAAWCVKQFGPGSYCYNPYLPPFSIQRL